MKWLDALLDKAIERRLRKSVAPLGGWQPKAVGCWTCGMHHRLPSSPREALASAEGFFDRHLGHETNWLEVPGIAGLPLGNSDLKMALQSTTTLTVTNLHSTASSPTAGWQGAVTDNTSGLYLDAQLVVNLDFANTAPANSKAAFVFSYAGIESGVYSYPATGTEGSITLPDVTTAQGNNLRLMGAVQYTTQDAAIPGPMMSYRQAWGWLPPYFGPAIINHSGAALAGSGNTVKHRLTHLTIV